MSALKSMPNSRAGSSLGAGLTTTSYLVLGMVGLGLKSGYEIKKAAALSTQALWSISLAQVYPELSRLTAAELLTRRNDPHGARARSAYSVTERGEAAFRAWLRSHKPAPFQIHDEGLLRLLFADVLPRADQLSLIRQMREKDHKKTARLQSDFPLAVDTYFSGTSYPAVVGSMAADTSEYSEEWLDDLAARLETEPWRSAGPLNSMPLAGSHRRPKAAIKLTTFSFMVLGMVRLGCRSGQAIRRFADFSTQVFWPTSFAQLYRELARLEAANLLVNRSHGPASREQAAYAVTDRGVAALLAWLRSPKMSLPRPRHEGLLCLFFADALPAAEQLELVGQIRAYFRDAGDYVRDEVLPLGYAAVERGILHPSNVARLGGARYDYMAGWLARFEADQRPGPQWSRK